VVVLVLIALALPDKPIPDEDYVPITGGGFPLPPLDLKVPETTPRQKALAKAQLKAAKRKPVAVGTGSSAASERTSESSQKGAQDGDV
jgi:NADH-quinone oxidoreductase subunit H